MPIHFDVSGNDIYFGNRCVGTLSPTLWSTLRDAVTMRLECAEAGSVPAAEHADDIRELEGVIAGLRVEIAKLKASTTKREIKPTQAAT